MVTNYYKIVSRRKIFLENVLLGQVCDWMQYIWEVLLLLLSSRTKALRESQRTWLNNTIAKEGHQVAK